MHQIVLRTPYNVEVRYVAYLGNAAYIVILTPHTMLYCHNSLQIARYVETKNMDIMHIYGASPLSQLSWNVSPSQFAR